MWSRPRSASTTRPRPRRAAGSASIPPPAAWWCRARCTADRILLNARALGVYGSSPIPQNGADTLCIAPDNFVIAAARQCRSGQTPAPFTKITPTQTDDGNLVAYLAEDSEYDDEQARLAGIQRLLVIAGYDAAPIDGVDGPKTQAALAAFLKSRGLTAGGRCRRRISSPP